MPVSRREFVRGAGLAGAALSFGVTKHAIGRAAESAVAARQDGPTLEDAPTRQDDIWIDALGGLRFGPEGFDEIERSGLTMIETTLGAPGDPPFGYEQAVQDIASWHGIFNRYPDRVIHVRRSADILEAKRTGGIAVMIGFQNATHLKRDLANVEFFYNLGIRQMQLTYNSLNALGGGCTRIAGPSATIRAARRSTMSLGNATPTHPSVLRSLTVRTFRFPPSTILRRHPGISYMVANTKPTYPCVEYC